MDENEKRHLVGYVILEDQKKEKELHFLKAKAIQIGNSMIALAERLKRDPENVAFYFTPEVANYKWSEKIIKFEPINYLDTITSICQEIRKTLVELQDLEEQKMLLGLGP